MNFITKIIAINSLLIASAFIFSSCNEPNKKQEVSEIIKINTLKLNIDSIIENIDLKRKEIEQLKTAPIELTTENLRSKIKQKWSNLHFYIENDKLVKVKTYPHKGISERTEEFYAINEKLILAVIEDDGSGPKGKEKILLDKMYYFNNDSLIKVVKNNKEVEYNIKHSDAKELLSEFQEYYQLFKASVK